MMAVAILVIVAVLLIHKIIDINRNKFYIPVGIIALGVISGIVFIVEVLKLGKINNFDIYSGFLIDGGAVVILFIILKDFNLINVKLNKKTPKKKKRDNVRLHSDEEDNEWECIDSTEED